MVMQESAWKHLRIIPDGGRRWARRNGVTYADAYRRSFLRLADLLSGAYRVGFQEASIYLLSKDNLSRPTKELDAVYEAVASLLKGLRHLSKNGVCSEVCLAGEVNLLPDEVRSFLLSTDSLRGDGSGMRVNLLAAYNSWDEVTCAASRSSRRITLKDLWVNTRIDAVIRTGGSALLSGFLPMQSQYAHILTSDKMFNDLSDTDFEQLLKAAASVTHLFGK